MARFTIPVAGRIRDMEYRLKRADGTPVDNTVAERIRGAAAGGPVFGAGTYLADGLPIRMDGKMRDAAVRGPVIRGAILTSIAPAGTIGLDAIPGWCRRPRLPMAERERPSLRAYTGSIEATIPDAYFLGCDYRALAPVF